MSWNRLSAIVFGVIASAFAASVAIGEPQAADDDRSVTIATGRIGGLYHPVGGAICKLVNDNWDVHGVSCTVEISSGSIENIKELRARSVNLAIAQSDWQHDAYKGVGPFKDSGPFDALRSLFAIFVEQFTIVVRSDKKIDSFEDLKGKRLYMGGLDWGRRETIQFLMKAYGWTPDDFVDISEFKAANKAEALCDNEFDAFAYTIGHPNPVVREAMSTCGAKLLPVDGPIVDKLVKINPLYIASSVPAGTYRDQTLDVPGLGIVATLVAPSETSPDITYQVTKAFFENLANLRDLSPIFSTLSEAEMTRVGLTAPLHEGAARYFHEASLM